MKGQELYELRKRMGLSRERFARLVNVSASSIKNWELERNKPSPLAEERLEQIRKETERRR